MDWAAASGAPSWGAAAAAAAAADPGPTMLSFAGPSSSPAAAEAGLQDFATGLAQRERPAGAAGAGRRSRSAAAAAEVCSVDGCRSDLSRCRDYHRRHRVCEAHSKTPVVVVGGQEQRFCQQCSRFHMLSEFDEGKRSCRKRLDGHNRRRRKPQHDLTNLGGFLPYHQVNQFEFYPRTIPTAHQNSDTVHLVDHQPPFSISFSRTTKQFPFPQDGGRLASASHHGHFWLKIATILEAAHATTISPARWTPSVLSLFCHHRCIIPPHPDKLKSLLLSRITSASQQVATTAVTTALASSGIHHVFVPDAVFEDPSQALPFPWQ